MEVYSDFFSYASGIYTHTSGVDEGGHAILIVGYTDDSTVPGGGYFSVKNSWGTGWGEKGFFRIAYSELTSPVQFGQYTLSYDTVNAPCTFTNDSENFTMPSGSSINYIYLYTAPSCSWSASSNASWLTLYPTTPIGKGNGQIAYGFSSNPGTTPRTAVVTIYDSTGKAASTATITEAAPLPKFNVTGTIRSGSNTGPLLSGATVSLAGQTTTTSSAGTFTISGITSGTYQLSITKAGYVTYTNSSYPVTGNATLNYNLAKKPS
jgi:hypothetical protein